MSLALLGIFWHAKEFPKTPEVDTDAENTTGINTMAYDALTNDSIVLTIFYNVFHNHFQTLVQCEACTTITPEFENFLNYVSIRHQFLDSMTPP